MRNTKKLTLCALFTALTAIFSQIAIPLGPVPVNLATFSALLSGALLGSKMGGVSQLAYVLLGAMGAPVFALFRGGINVLLGPTGGYLAGYVLSAWTAGRIVERRGDTAAMLTLAMTAGTFACLIPGIGWYMLLTKNGLAASLAVCAVPFFPGDAIKIAAAVILAKRLRPALVGRREDVSA